MNFNKINIYPHQERSWPLPENYKLPSSPGSLFMVNTTLIHFFRLFSLKLFSYYLHDKVIAISLHMNIIHFDHIYSQCFSFLPPKQITILIFNTKSDLPF